MFKKIYLFKLRINVILYFLRIYLEVNKYIYMYSKCYSCMFEFLMKEIF